MKKDKKFLEALRCNLKGLSKKKKEEIINKYQEIISNEKDSGKKITVILKNLGNPEDIALNEIKNVKASSFNVFKIDNFSRLKDFLIKDRKIEFIKKNKKIKNNNIITSNKNLEIEDNFPKVTKNVNNSKLFKKKSNVDKIDKGIKEEINGINDDEVSNEVSVVSKKNIPESKSFNRKRIIIKVIGILILVFVLFIFLWANILFLASIFAFLDGVKIIGLNLVLLGLNILIFWLFIMLNKLIFKKKNNYKLNLIIIISSIMVIALGVALFFYKIYHTEEIQDVSDKYSMTSVYDKLDLPSDVSKKFYITFNSNYKNDYIVEYDENLKDQIKLEVKYYENYYDYYVKKTNNNIYISLKIDDRDRISSYISDFKDGKIYSTDELSRYTIKITINENDKDRLEIIN